MDLPNTMTDVRIETHLAADGEDSDDLGFVFLGLTLGALFAAGSNPV